MTYLISLIVMIALSVIVAVLSFSNIGSNFSDSGAKVEAQKILNTVAEIQAAYIANQSIYGNQEFSDGAELLAVLTSDERRLLRKRSLEELNFDARLQGSEGILISATDSDKVCQYINHQFNNVPVDTPIPSCDTNPQGLACCNNE